MKGEIYMMKYLSDASPYYQIVRGNFRYQEAALEKAEELKQDPTVEKIESRKRTDRDIKKVYRWNRGFETIYLGR